jgi:hypothetical protein
MGVDMRRIFYGELRGCEAKTRDSVFPQPDVVHPYGRTVGDGTHIALRRPTAGTGKELSLRPGEWVEVRSADEILATLDERSCLDALPFMPEMLQFCGKRFRVYKSAHKTCDGGSSSRRMIGAVLLEGLRCDGQAHGGCQASCLLFWKQAWLKRVPGNVSQAKHTSETRLVSARRELTSDPEVLARCTRAPAVEGAEAEVRYFCQATNLLEATTRLRWWDPRHYVMDVMSGNVSLRNFLYYVGIAAFNVVMRRIRFERRHAYPYYPYVPGCAAGKTPTEVLNLQPGEIVQVRSKDEIMRTINADRKNRGLLFDVEMEPHCGKTYQVLSRVQRIIDEKTGKMINIARDCLILDGVTCSGCLSRSRLFCPRSIYSYWREIWLKRVSGIRPGTSQ